MTIKTMLVPMLGSAVDEQSLTAAATAARALSAHIDAVHVRPDAVELAMAVGADASGSTGILMPGLIDELERSGNERAAAARGLFDAFCTRAGLTDGKAPSAPCTAASAEFHIETGQETAWLLRYAVTADLIVASRGRDGDASLQPLLESLLMDGGRPLLIPDAARPTTDLDRVVIAWKPTPQTGRAVTAAMPLLMRAKHITAVTIAEKDQDVGDDIGCLLRYLTWHGLPAAAECVRPGGKDPVHALLDATQHAGANLLVLGAYGHSRVREWVFGGFTRRILSDAPLPVLLAH